MYIKIFLVVFLVFLDFLTKKLVFNFIDLNNFISIYSFFDLAHIHNYGISFGLFSNILPSYLFVIIGIFLTFFIFYMYLKSNQIYEKWGFIIIISGALSNISDRLLNGFVLDFLYFHYKDFYWPAFNFADIYITIGLCMIILQMIKNLKRA
jgi:signal peptidase II